MVGGERLELGGPEGGLDMDAHNALVPLPCPLAHGVADVLEPSVEVGAELEVRPVEDEAPVRLRAADPALFRMALLEEFRFNLLRDPALPIEAAYVGA